MACSVGQAAASRLSKVRLVEKSLALKDANIDTVVFLSNIGSSTFTCWGV